MTHYGQIWFRSPYQLGLTVDGYGDGLIIIGYWVNHRQVTARRRERRDHDLWSRRPERSQHCAIAG